MGPEGENTTQSSKALRQTASRIHPQRFILIRLRCRYRPRLRVPYFVAEKQIPHRRSPRTATGFGMTARSKDERQRRKAGPSPPLVPQGRLNDSQNTATVALGKTDAF